MHVPVPVIIAIDKAINAYLQLGDNVSSKLAKLDDKLVAIELRGLNTNLYFIRDNDKLSVRSFADETPDAIISATPLMLAQMAVQKNADKALFAGQMKITGDLVAAQTLQDILSGADIDWEEHLSSLVGDVMAHQVSRGLRGLFNWTDNSQSSLQADLSEFLLHEAKLLPDRQDLNNFLDDVDTLRSDIERFSVRLDRYEHSNKT